MADDAPAGTRRDVKGRARSIAGALVALSCWAPSVAAAEITLDGDVIDARMTRLGSAYLLDRDERCPPASDALLRERVVEKLLLQREFVRQLRRSDSKHSRKMLEQYAMQERNVEEMLGLGLPYAAAIYRYPADHYDFAEVAPISREEIAKEYARMVDARHPLVVDAVAVRVKSARAVGDDQIRTLEGVFASGGDVADMRRALGYPAAGPLDAGRWLPVMPAGSDPVPDFDGESWSDRVPGWSPDIAVGRVLGPEARWLHPDQTTHEVLSHTYHEIVDRRKIDRIELRGGPTELESFVRLRIRSVLERRRFDAMRDRLRAEADVRVDGRSVSADVAFDGCDPTAAESEFAG